MHPRRRSGLVPPSILIELAARNIIGYVVACITGRYRPERHILSVGDAGCRERSGLSSDDVSVLPDLRRFRKSILKSAIIALVAAFWPAPCLPAFSLVQSPHDPSLESSLPISATDSN